jgi:hypothetical protein
MLRCLAKRKHERALLHRSAVGLDLKKSRQNPVRRRKLKKRKKNNNSELTRLCFSPTHAVKLSWYEVAALGVIVGSIGVEFWIHYRRRELELRKFVELRTRAREDRSEETYREMIHMLNAGEFRLSFSFLRARVCVPDRC